MHDFWAETAWVSRSQARTRRSRLARSARRNHATYCPHATAPCVKWADRPKPVQTSQLEDSSGQSRGQAGAPVDGRCSSKVGAGERQWARRCCLGSSGRTLAYRVCRDVATDADPRPTPAAARSARRCRHHCRVARLNSSPQISNRVTNSGGLCASEILQNPWPPPHPPPALTVRIVILRAPPSGGGTLPVLHVACGGTSAVTAHVNPCRPNTGAPVCQRSGPVLVRLPTCREADGKRGGRSWSRC
jgi:hypothetical protein